VNTIPLHSKPSAYKKGKAEPLQAWSGPEGSRKLKGKAVPLQAWSGPEGSRKLKGKTVPLQACNGPEDSRKLKFPDFLTTAHDGGKVVSLTNRPHLPPGNTPGTHFC
jgi:hypothetical protein